MKKIIGSENIESSEKEFNPVVPKIEIKEPVPMAVEFLIDIRDKINLQPDFQREFVWPVNKQKELIKSLYRNIPLPMFYFAKKHTGEFEVIDGQQRLTTILGFIDRATIPKHIRNKLAKKIELKDSNNKKISMDDLKKIVKDRRIYYVEIPDDNLSLTQKYEMFQTLNKGAVTLKPQEIRNCMFQAEIPYLNNILKKNATALKRLLNAEFRRMEGEEYVLRFFMINSRGYGEKRVSDLLDNIELIKKELTEKNIKDLSKRFKKFLGRLEKLFDQKKTFEHYFQVLAKDARQPNKSTDINKYIFSGKINQGLYHLFSYFLPKFDNNQFNKINKNKAQKGFIKLLQNKEFIKYITGSGTDSPKNIKKSKEIFETEFVKKYLGEPTNKSRRNITLQEKRALFANIPYCYLCYGKIKDVREAQGEHIESFDSGNDSSFKNILLAHKKCNNEKRSRSLIEYRDTPKSIKRRKKNKQNISEYLKCLKDWHKSHPLDQYKVLKEYALRDRII